MSSTCIALRILHNLNKFFFTVIKRICFDCYFESAFSVRSLQNSSNEFIDRIYYLPSSLMRNIISHFLFHIAFLTLICRYPYTFYILYYTSYEMLRFMFSLQWRELHSTIYLSVYTLGSNQYRFEYYHWI